MGTAVIGNLAVAVVGIVVMGTEVFGFCGLYSLLSINTACKISPKKEEKKEAQQQRYLV